MLREPSINAVAAPAQGEPPPATTPTRPNWLPPENISSDNAIVWATDSPPAIATAPKDTAYAPVVTETPSESRSTFRRDASGSRSGLAAIVSSRSAPPPVLPEALCHQPGPRRATDRCQPGVVPPGRERSTRRPMPSVRFVPNVGTMIQLNGLTKKYGDKT